MCWWQRYFGSDDYLLLEGAPREDRVEQMAAFICDVLEIGPGCRVLDAGCGLGLHALALARRGCLVTAIDASAYMIERCQRLTADERRLTIKQVDFHTMAFDRQFSAVLCLGNTLGFGTREDDAEAVRRMAASLVDGGRLLIELHNFAWFRDNMVGRTWWEEAEAFVLSDAAYDEADQKLVTRDIILPKDGGPPREYQMSLLQYRPEEVERLLGSVGLTDIRFYGDACRAEHGLMFSCEGFNERSREMVVTCSRPDR